MENKELLKRITKLEAKARAMANECQKIRLALKPKKTHQKGVRSYMDF